MMFQTGRKKTLPEVVFEIIICALIGGLIGAALVYGAGMEPMI